MRGPDAAARGRGGARPRRGVPPHVGRDGGTARSRRRAHATELALLVAYSKRSIKRDLLDSDLADAPYLERDLADYFPERIAERFDSLLTEHPLRRELTATIVANDVVNSQGVTFVSRLVAETGATPAEVVRAGSPATSRARRIAGTTWRPSTGRSTPRSRTS